MLTTDLVHCLSSTLEISTPIKASVSPKDWAAYEVAATDEHGISMGSAMSYDAPEETAGDTFGDKEDTSEV